jgi:ribosomal protein S18 acetylase RimI-like enzyme
MIAVRRATPGDVERLIELWMQMWEFHRKLDARFEPSPMAALTMRHWLEGHLESPSSAVFSAADESGTVVGYILASILENLPIVQNPAFGFISEIAVDEKYRRRGVGGRLVRAAHEWIRSKGISSVEVNLAAANAASRAFWKKMGYRDFVERLQLPLP